MGRKKLEEEINDRINIYYSIKLNFIDGLSTEELNFFLAVLLNINIVFKFEFYEHILKYPKIKKLNINEFIIYKLIDDKEIISYDVTLSIIEAYAMKDLGYKVIQLGRELTEEDSSINLLEHIENYMI